MEIEGCTVRVNTEVNTIITIGCPGRLDIGQRISRLLSMEVEGKND